MTTKERLNTAAIIACLGSLPGLAFSASNAELEAQVKQLQRDLAEMKALMREITTSQVTKKEVAVMKKQVESVKKTQLEEKNAASQVHLAGYAQFNYTANDRTYYEDGVKKKKYNEFSNSTFSPIFHYQYKDLLMFESEMSMTINELGETDTEVEYMTADLLINDNMTFLVGKFLSPIGQFRQNIHPGWINKLPTAPSGFGHDQAAPIANVGAQLRGGFYLADTQFNYATYVGNGPKLGGSHDGGGIAIEANGSTSNDNNELTYGGRIGILPVDGLEIGLSAATGKAALTYFDTVENIERTEKNRDYDVLGADFVYNFKKFQARGEYISQELGSLRTSEVDPSSNKWSSWYVQGAYKFSPSKWESVLRYSDYDAPGNLVDQEQWSLGLNYLFANNIIGKIAYDFNDGTKNTLSDEDKITLQMTYGF